MIAGAILALPKRIITMSRPHVRSKAAFRVQALACVLDSHGCKLKLELSTRIRLFRRRFNLCALDRLFTLRSSHEKQCFTSDPSMRSKFLPPPDWIL